ncbi:class I SAM-dependent methyltransferase [Methanosarcina sp. 2.H.A.1B.4]|uniref:class I SAM-dependent methyltransferase n=1 Tax=Methanosarcina sp. 2.H.A.1B.4 TaxID=1483600 RepID=UPI0006210E84|nr:methyltransferase domain-containing protein [Methanosarcina sp. 2.H.A.1B.4]KKG07857.1 SAM-dependent methlyltransferase [Methanosarcina sp. 2.H.A.1B.4]
MSNMETVLNKSEFSWKEYFSDKKKGGHRFSTEEFLAKEAQEKLFHLGGGKTLLDFGCGAGELLIYYIPKYERVVGADFSSSMLFEAEKKIWQQKYKNVDLILADDNTVWDKLSLSFDRITATAVIQYLTPEQIDAFIRNASEYLNEEGKIVFFDIIDPRLYSLWKLGWFSENFRLWKSLSKVGMGCLRQVSGILKNRPGDIIGDTHNPYLIEKIANMHGFKMEYVKSMYYEYRYHVILSKMS